MPIVDNAFIGHFLGTVPLSAAALSNTLFNLTWLFLLGVSSGMDHFASQAFGADNLPLVNVWTVRALVVVCVCSFPVILFLLSSGWIVRVVLRADETTASLALTFSRITAASVPILYDTFFFFFWFNNHFF